MTNNKLNTIEFPPNQYPYRIRNWRKFQHYKSGRGQPPWIKLHVELLRNPDWLRWPDSTKLSAICCMLVASMYDGCLPDDSVFVKRLCHLDWRVDFKPLIECGFLEKRLANASTLQANAILETETYREETETETDKKVSIGQPLVDPTNVPQGTKKKGTSEGARGTRLEEGWLPSSEVHLFAVGILGESGAAAELDKFRDYWLSKAGAGARKTDWGRTFRNWCRTAKERKGNGNGYGRQKSHKERYSDLLQSLGSGEIREDVARVIPKLDSF